MAGRDDATITVSRGQIKAALGAWHDEAAAEGLEYRPPDAVIEEQADYLMMLCRKEGAK